jgi:hypothetical protein
MRSFCFWVVLSTAAAAQTPQSTPPPIPSDGLGSATRDSLAAVNDCVLKTTRAQPPLTEPAKFRALRRCIGVKAP